MNSEDNTKDGDGLPSELLRGMEAAFGADAEAVDPDGGDAVVGEREENPPGLAATAAWGESVVDRLADETGTKPGVSLRRGPEASSSSSGPLRFVEGANKYALGDELGRGGVGSVYRGIDRDLGRDVAIKFLHDRFRTHAPFVERFVEEAQIGGQLQHPGIVPVYDLGMADGKPFFAMKLIEGRDLSALLGERESPASERRRFLSIFEQVCQTVAYAHARGVVHRDLKPANVMVGAFGEVQVVDWGMGKVLPEPSSGEPVLSAPEDEATGAHPNEVKASGPDGSSVSGSTTRGVATVRSSGDGSQSVAGSVMGTPAYMPREQALGLVDAMDERSDVFALGAMLCEVLTGAPPYVGPADQVIGMAAMADLSAARKRLAESAADPELIELAELCLQKAPAGRPRSARVVAERVQAYLAAAEAKIHEAQVTAAEERVRSAAARTRQRLALALAAVVASGLAAAVWLWSEADTQRSAAETNLANFDRLALVVKLESARDAERALYPAWPEQVPAMTAWMEAHGRQLRAARIELQATLDALQERAAPQADDERQRARRAHPKAEELETTRALVVQLEQAQKVRAGTAEPPEFELNPADLPDSGIELAALARPLVDPYRQKFGREVEGLALARLASRKAPSGGTERARILDTLGWALLANGLDEEAKQRGRESLEVVHPAERVILARYSSGLESAAQTMQEGGGERSLAQHRARLEALQQQVEKDVRTKFDDDSDTFLFDTLRGLLEEIEAFDAKEIAGVERRLAWAKRVEELTIHRFRDGWDAARAAIAAADGVLASKRYGSSPLDLRPQVGLVPIGKNPQSGLWEFYHLRSAWDPAGGVDPADLEIPQHAADGTLPTKGSGLVFVLVPGQEFWMGGQKHDPRAPNHDPDLRSEEGPVRRVPLDPYLLSRFEMTQGQWARLLDGDFPSWWNIGADFDGVPGVIDERHPVESIDWTRANTALARFGLLLPTEAQWECACRAGTTTPWSTGSTSESLDGFANVLDQTGQNVVPVWPGGEAFDDRYKGPSPVGTYRPNGFGFHDMHGNVWEWCQDSYRPYPIDARPGDGLRDGAPSGSRSLRGGGFSSDGKGVRAAFRDHNTPTYSGNQVGVRPVRPLAR